MRTLKCFCLECGIWNQVKSENFETEEICFECGGELKVVGEYRAIFLGMSLKDQNEKRAILRQEV